MAQDLLCHFIFHFRCQIITHPTCLPKWGRLFRSCKLCDILGWMTVTLTFDHQLDEINLGSGCLYTCTIAFPLCVLQNFQIVIQRSLPSPRKTKNLANSVSKKCIERKAFLEWIMLGQLGPYDLLCKLEKGVCRFLQLAGFLCQGEERDWWKSELHVCSCCVSDSYQLCHSFLMLIDSLALNPIGLNTWRSWQLH